MKYAPIPWLVLLAACAPANMWPDDHDNDAIESITLPAEVEVPGRFRASGDVPNSYVRDLERGQASLPADTHLEFACEKQALFNDAALNRLAPLARLRLVEIRGTPGLTVAGLVQLAGMKKLSQLRLIESVRLNDDALEQIAGASGLESLTLGPCTDVTNSGLGKLGKLKNLRVLVIYEYPAITEPGFEALQQALPQLRIFKYRELP